MSKETNMEALAGFCGGTLVLMIIYGILMGFSRGDVSALALAIICIIILAFILYGGNNEKKSKPRVF